MSFYFPLVEPGKITIITAFRPTVGQDVIEHLLLGFAYEAKHRHEKIIVKLLTTTGYATRFRDNIKTYNDLYGLQMYPLIPFKPGFVLNEKNLNSLRQHFLESGARPDILMIAPFEMFYWGSTEPKKQILSRLKQLAVEFDMAILVLHLGVTTWEQLIPDKKERKQRKTLPPEKKKELVKKLSAFFGVFDILLVSDANPNPTEEWTYENLYVYYPQKNPEVHKLEVIFYHNHPEFTGFSMGNIGYLCEKLFYSQEALASH